MKYPLISIIVPCYNVERYLPKCIDSILSQTYKNIEIWLVDDGSPDNCGKICDEYAEKDNRIKVIHKENGGLSDARNAALDMMNGEYVTFVDSDDYVATDYVEIMYNLIVKYNAQIAVTLHICFYEGMEPKQDTCNGDKIRVFSREEAIQNMFYQKDFDTMAWAKIYHRSLFADEIRYPKGWLYEDLPTTYRLMEKCMKIAFCNYKGYYYLLRYNSIEGQPFKPAKYESCMNIVKLFEEERSSMPQKTQKALNCRIVSLLFHILLDVPFYQNQIRINIVRKIKKMRLGVLFDPKARNKTRVACLLSLFGMNAVYMFAAKGKSRKQ